MRGEERTGEGDVSYHFERIFLLSFELFETVSFERKGGGGGKFRWLDVGDAMLYCSYPPTRHLPPANIPMARLGTQLKRFLLSLLSLSQSHPQPPPHPPRYPPPQQIIIPVLKKTTTNIKIRNATQTRLPNLPLLLHRRASDPQSALFHHQQLQIIRQQQQLQSQRTRSPPLPMDPLREHDPPAGQADGCLHGVPSRCGRVAVCVLCACGELCTFDIYSLPLSID